MNTLKEYDDLKIVINGKTYESIDELPDSVKRIVGDRLSAVPEPAGPENAPLEKQEMPQSQIVEPETLGNRMILVTLSVLFVGWFLFKLGMLHA